MNIEKILGKFELFDPLLHERPNISRNESGTYIICLRKGCKLPAGEHPIYYQQFRGFNVIYNGKSECLYKRLHRNHFKDKASSTFRRSVGVIQDFTLIHHYSDSGRKRVRFSDKQEKQLTKIMRKQMIVFYYPTKDFERLEKELIKYF